MQKKPVWYKPACRYICACIRFCQRW